MWGEGWGSACPVRVAMLQGGFPTRLGGVPPDLRSVSPPSTPLSTQRGQKEGYPVLFTHAQTVFRDPSFRAPPRGEWERRKGERVKQGAAEGGTNGKGARQHRQRAPVGMPRLHTKRYTNRACQLGRGGGWAGRGKRRGACAHRSVHVGWEGDATPETGAGGERRGAVPHKLAFASSSCLHMMNEGAGGRGEAYLSHAPFARKWVQGVHTKGGKERVGKGGWKGQAQDPTCVNTQM
ncbi:hypothetical protein EDB89DRAFT_1912933 [Lactarius sanguifluus]|nr:hypothetical protein EDB89DRAFT_1912933 [Lactarius sanguifluus]